jgi:hypothetical protein
MRARVTTSDFGASHDPQGEHTQHARHSRRATLRSCGRRFRDGVAAAIVGGIFVASAAHASDEFKRGFEDQLGRSVARRLAHSVLDTHRPGAVRYVPSFYYREHRRHQHGRHHYEPHHYRASSRHRDGQAHAHGCGHLKARHREVRGNGLREHYVGHHSDRERRSQHDRRDDGRRWDSHS